MSNKVEVGDPLRALLVTEREEKAYYKGRADEARQHKCPKLKRRPYPKELMGRVDDLADAAFIAMGQDAYAIAEAVNDWFRAVPDGSEE